MMSTNLVPISDLERMAQAVAQSKLFGVTNQEQALALMLVAAAEGLHPATAARDYHIINGRPALKADAMLARYLNSGGRVEWGEHTDSKVEATFSHPAGGKLTIAWDMERAKKAGLGGKDMWAKYPRQMLRARVISEGIRATNPAVATGVYTPEELHDMDDVPKRARKEKDMGKAQVVEDAREEEVEKVTQEQIEAIHTALSECGVELTTVLAQACITDLKDMPALDGPKCVEWIRKRKKPAKAA